MKIGHTFCLLVLLLSPFWSEINAQNTSSKDIEVSFAQSEINFDYESGELSNILKIKNLSSVPIEAHIEVLMPDGWSLIFALPQKLTLPPNAEIFYLTLDFAIPDETLGGIKHEVTAKILTNNAKSTSSTVCHISIPEVRDWKIWSEKNEVYIPSKSKKIPFKLLLKNTGNLKETFSLKFQQNPNLIISKGIRKGLDLLPGQDTTLIYEAQYLPSSKPIQTISIRFEASNADSDKSEKGMMTFLLLEGQYNHGNTKKKNVSIEVSTGNMGSTNTIHTGLKASGEISVGKEREVNFSMTSQDILQPDTENTQYFIQYKSKKIKLESQNQIVKATYGNEENTFEKWSIGAIQDLKSGLTQLQYKQQKLLVDTRLSGGLNFYNDSQNGVQIGIANLMTDIPIHNKGKLYLSLQDILISDKGNETPYTTNSFQYFLRYESNPSLKWKTYFQSSYNSAHHPYGQQSVLQVQAQTAHQSLDKKHRIAIGGATNQKMPKAYDKGELLPPESYSRNLLSFNYNYLFLPQMNIEVGGQFEQLNAKRFSSLTETNLDYQTKTTEWSVGTAFKKYFWMNLKHKQYSIADFVSPGELYLYNNLPTFRTTDFRTQFQQNALSIGYQYRKADDHSRFLANTDAQNLTTEVHHALALTYQSRRVLVGAKYYSTNRNTRLIVPLHLQGEWFKRALKWKLSANAMHFFDTQTTTFFSRTDLDWRFAKGWHLLCKGQLLQKKQIVNIEDPETIQTQNTKFELGLKKNFHFDPLGDKTYDLAIQCFRDENGNGIFDKGETSIPDVRLHLTPVKDPSFPNNNFKEAAIFSTAKNQSQFKSLPQGVYQLSVHQLFPDNDGYFNTTSESIRIDLTSNKTLQLAFGKGRVIKGKLNIKRDDNSSYESLPVKGIRITATNPTGRAFSALTDKKGNFTIFVPFSDYYIVETNNPYGEDFQLTKGSEKITFSGSEEIPLVEFLIEEAAIEIEWN